MEHILSCKWNVSDSVFQMHTKCDDMRYIWYEIMLPFFFFPHKLTHFFFFFYYSDFKFFFQSVTFCTVLFYVFEWINSAEITYHVIILMFIYGILILFNQPMSRPGNMSLKGLLILDFKKHVPLQLNYDLEEIIGKKSLISCIFWNEQWCIWKKYQRVHAISRGKTSESICCLISI